MPGTLRGSHLGAPGAMPRIEARLTRIGQARRASGPRGMVPPMRRLAHAFFAVTLLAAPACAVAPIFDAAGGGFFDLPFPHELRRDADGTVSIAGFPFPSSPLVDQYRDAIETTAGFGLASGVFFRFDGAIDPTSLPVDSEASRQPGASVFMLDVDPQSPARGTRLPLWIDFRAPADAYRPGNLLTIMPVPGHTLTPGTL